jgi:hypothetical protein
MVRRVDSLSGAGIQDAVEKGNTSYPFLQSFTGRKAYLDASAGGEL